MGQRHRAAGVVAVGKYDAVATRSLAQIKKKGAAVKFPGAAPGVYDPITNTWSGSVTGDVYGQAVQIEGDPDTLKALELIGVDNVSLLVGNEFRDAPTGGSVIDFTPRAPMTFEWPVGGTAYTIRKADDVAPDGTSIVYELVGGV